MFILHYFLDSNVPGLQLDPNEENWSKIDKNWLTYGQAQHLALSRQAQVKTTWLYLT